MPPPPPAAPRRSPRLGGGNAGWRSRRRSRQLSLGQTRTGGRPEAGPTGRHCWLQWCLQWFQNYHKKLQAGRFAVSLASWTAKPPTLRFPGWIGYPLGLHCCQSRPRTAAKPVWRCLRRHWAPRPSIGPPIRPGGARFQCHPQRGRAGGLPAKQRPHLRNCSRKPSAAASRARSQKRLPPLLKLLNCPFDPAGWGISCELFAMARQGMRPAGRGVYF